MKVKDYPRTRSLLTAHEAAALEGGIAASARTVVLHELAAHGVLGVDHEGAPIPDPLWPTHAPTPRAPRPMSVPVSFGRARRPRRLPAWVGQVAATVGISVGYTVAWLLVFDLMHGRLP